MPKSYRIFFLATWFPNRYDSMFGLFVLRHAEVLAETQPVEVLFVMPDVSVSQTDIVTEEKGNLKINRIYYPPSRSFIKPLRKLINVYRYYSLQKNWIRKMARAGHLPDIIHVHVLTRSALAALWAKRKYGIPYIVTEHWSRYHSGTGLYKGWLRKYLTKIAVRRAAVMTVVSHHLMRAMKQWGLENPRYMKVYNVVDPGVFKPVEKPVRVVKEIVHVSCFDEHAKNISGILRSIRKLSEKRDDFRVKMIGDGPDWEMLVKYAREIGLDENRVEFTGLLEGKSLSAQMARADFLVMFSHRENMPVVLFEAFACGLPVVSSDVGGISEIVTKDRGLLVQAGNETAFCGALDWMLDHHTEFRKEDIRAFAISHASPAAVRDAFGKIYQSVLPA